MRIWRAGDLLLPLRATSSCHRCRSRAGWRDRQVLSGCKSIDIASATYVNARSKAAMEKRATSDHLRRLTANTCKDGLLANMYRAKCTSTGTYAGNTSVRIDLMTD